MAYDKSDPRASLAGNTVKKPVCGLVADPHLATFYDTPAQVKDGNGSSWFIRGHNFVLVHSNAEKGGVFVRVNQDDEYVLLLTDNGASVEVDGEITIVPANSIAFVPPGDSIITIPEGGVFHRLFSSKPSDLVALCPNATAYERPIAHIPEFHAWPMPVGGWKLRHYTLDVPKEEGRFGRIFRCTTFMVNVLDPYDGPRDTTKMSPHHHDDFEQCSLVLEGEYAHHLRWPWTTDLSDWRADQELAVDAHSALVIPPPAIHTSRATGAGRNAMVDIFSPPRMDFSLKSGWVLNADDYPVPE